MRHAFGRSLGALLMLTAATQAAPAAEEASTVKVALLDMSSIMPTGVTGYSMMGPGMMGSGMMGSGMMSPGNWSGMMGSQMMSPGNWSGMMGGMMSIRIDKPSIKTGSVTFDIINWSRSVLHEVLIVPVDNQSAPLPYDYGQALVPEEQVKVLVDTGGLNPNASKSVEVKLAPGAYLVICNLPGHYAAGMATPLNVVP